MYGGLGIIDIVLWESYEQWISFRYFREMVKKEITYE